MERSDYQVKVDTLLKLIDGKAYKLAEVACNKDSKSLSHLSKPAQALVLNEAKIVIINHLIMHLSKI